MNSRSSTAGSFSAASKTALATPRSSAMSPPIRTCTFIVPILVVWNVAMSTKLVRDDRSPRSGFDQRVDVDELRAAPLGLGQPGEHPRSVRGGVVTHQPDCVGGRPVAQVTVPLPVPIAAVSARPLASWHMFEQSGRLFVPNSRTQSW